MEAISINDDALAEVNQDRCIGCGLCVTTCPEEALKLEPKQKDQYQMPYESAREMMMSITEKRGTSLIPLAMQEPGSE